ncbi:zinc ribbon domain-containing protein [Halorhabdus sp. CUG00001]|uniref:zinc ribbon domain-containing protein n=1 Tax=Halorhabdus sp. CUG00001 TaxID=2600297 RepID=UPI00131AECCF|nr:zinc ribbon domain-containing protein [Halorhabdus sp. CUG00001]
MPDRYCPACGIELDHDPRYCPECGTDLENQQSEDEHSISSNSWSWRDPSGPFRSPRLALRSVIVVGFVSFLLSIGLNAVGLPINELPHPVPIALFAFWAGVIMIGLPLWGLLHITDNVLGFLKHE